MSEETIEAQRAEACAQHVAEASQHLTDIGESLASIDRLLGGIESQLVTMRTHAAQYAEAAHFAKLYSVEMRFALSSGYVPAFSSAPEYSKINSLTTRLKVASQQVGGLCNELVRFSS